MVCRMDELTETLRRICLARCLLATLAPRGPERTDALHGLNAALELLARAEVEPDASDAGTAGVDFAAFGAGTAGDE
jgi:hypothetical protein